MNSEKIEGLKDTLIVRRDVRVISARGMAEAFVEQDEEGTIVVVPMDDCIVESIWSDKHNRLVAVVRLDPDQGKSVW